MWQLFIIVFVVVDCQSIKRDVVLEAVLEQKLLENVSPILESYISDHLKAKYTSLVEMNKEMIRRLEKKMKKEIDNLAKDRNGVVFTRWGRKGCPANVTTIVYTGYAGGSDYTHVGAAVDYVCLPHEPVWGPKSDLTYSNDDIAYMFGAEYQSPGDLFGGTDYMDDVPCAVCLGNQYTTSIMIPGRITCYPGWTEAYHGNLAAGAQNHKAASQYACVDQEPEISKSGVNENGKLFYGVQTKCGSLPCPPYVDNKFLPCVVCMK